MAYLGERLGIAATFLLCVWPALALAGEDWLIARVNGQWTWDSAGPQGRVQKKFLNQEVLRLGEDGQLTVVSALPFAAGVTATCSETARRDPKQACSSAFLDCRLAGGGGFSVLWGYVTEGGKGATNARNGYSCTFNEDAVLEAAHAVGLVETIAPKKSAKEAEAANPAATGSLGPLFNPSD